MTRRSQGSHHKASVFDSHLGDEAWAARAACAGHPYPDIFFPEQVRGEARRPGPTDQRSAAEALRICRSCPVQLDCLRFALEHDDIKGVWGATTTATARRGSASGRGMKPARHFAPLSSKMLNPPSSSLLVDIPLAAFEIAWDVVVKFAASLARARL